MSERTFAAWVEPIAAKLRDTRREIVVVAESTPDGAWEETSPLDPWTYKDLLAHLATGDWVCQSVLNMVVHGTEFDFQGPDDGNARFVQERREMPVAELIAEVEAEGEETQELLSQLKDEHQGLTREGARMNLGDYLRGFPGHDEQHLAQLRTAQEARRE